MEYSGEKLWELPSESHFLLEKYQHWEIEELACVANYLWSLLSDSFDRVEPVFVDSKLPEPPLDDSETSSLQSFKWSKALREAKYEPRLSSREGGIFAGSRIKNPHPYPDDTALLLSYGSEPAGSADSIKLRHQVRHALGNAWKYDPIRCSVKAAFHAARDLAATPKHGLTKEEYTWVTGGKLRTVKKPRVLAPADIELARKGYEWLRSSDEDEEIFQFGRTIIDQELDEFYGPDRTDLRPIHDDSDDEGFHEQNAITTTEVSLPDKSFKTRVSPWMKAMPNTLLPTRVPRTLRLSNHRGSERVIVCSIDSPLANKCGTNKKTGGPAMILERSSAVIISNRDTKGHRSLGHSSGRATGKPSAANSTYTRLLPKRFRN